MTETEGNLRSVVLDHFLLPCLFCFSLLRVDGQPWVTSSDELTAWNVPSQSTMHMLEMGFPDSAPFSSAL